MHPEQDIAADDAVLEASGQHLLLLHKPRVTGADKLGSAVNVSGSVRKIMVLQF